MKTLKTFAPIKSKNSASVPDAVHFMVHYDIMYNAECQNLLKLACTVQRKAVKKY